MLVMVPVFGAKASAPTNWAANLPGCHADNPAVGHHANQEVLGDQSNGPVPCGMLTGWPTVETRVEVTNDNAVIQGGWTPAADATLNAGIGMSVLRVACDLRDGWVVPDTNRIDWLSPCRQSQKAKFRISN